VITKEVNDWLKKVEAGTYRGEDALYALSDIAKYLTKDELKILKQKLLNHIHK